MHGFQVPGAADSDLLFQRIDRDASGLITLVEVRARNKNSMQAHTRSNIQARMSSGLGL